MEFKNFLIKMFGISKFCTKCGSLVSGKLICGRCQEYIDDLEEKKREEVKAKESMKRRNWIKLRENFLNKKDAV